MNIGKKRAGNVSTEQKRQLCVYMEQHENLKSGKFSNNFSVKTAQQLWQQIADTLNAIPGATKDWKMWRKVWQDMKSNAKKKNSTIKNYERGTGGGPPVDIVLTNEDKKILEIVGPSLTAGLDNVAESDCTFQGRGMDQIEILDDDIAENLSESNVADYIHPGFSKQLESYKNLEVTEGLEEEDEKENTKGASKSHPIFPTMTNVTSRNNVIKKPLKRTRLQSLDKCVTVSNSLLHITERKEKHRKQYLDAKLKLYEREVIAKEAIALHLNEMCDIFTKRT